MGYLLQEIFWYVAVAFALGGIIGWLMARRPALAGSAVALSDSGNLAADSGKPFDPIPANTTSADVEDIEGIGKAFGKRLRDAGISTTGELLDVASTDDGLARLCGIVSLDEYAVRGWAVMADLMRIPGIGGQWAEILWRSGVTSVQDLATRQSGPLLSHMRTVNEEEHCVPELPAEKQLEECIEAAARLEVRLPERPPA